MGKSKKSSCSSTKSQRMHKKSLVASFKSHLYLKDASYQAPEEEAVKNFLDSYFNSTTNKKNNPAVCKYCCNASSKTGMHVETWKCFRLNAKMVEHVLKCKQKHSPHGNASGAVDCDFFELIHLCDKSKEVEIGTEYSSLRTKLKNQSLLDRISTSENQSSKTHFTEDVIEKVQRAVVTSKESQVMTEKEKQKEIEKAWNTACATHALYLICCCDLPWSLLENFYFVNYRKHFYLGAVPVLSEVKGTFLNEEYARVIEELSKEFSNLDSTLTTSMAVDGWISISRSELMGIVVSAADLIYSNSLKHDCKTAVGIAVEIEKSKCEIEPILKRKINCIITDEASSNAKAKRYLAKRFPNVLFLRCFAHLLNLVCQDTLKVLDFNFISKCNIIVEKSRYGEFKNILLKIWETRHPNSQLPVLKRFAETRWNSAYNSVLSILKLEDELRIASENYSSKFQSKADKSLSSLDNSFFLKCRTILILLEPLVRMSLRMQKEDEVSLGEILPTFLRILRSYECISSTKKRKILCYKLSLRWSVLEQPILILATVLHPAFRDVFVPVLIKIKIAEECSLSSFMEVAALFYYNKFVPIEDEKRGDTSYRNRISKSLRHAIVKWLARRTMKNRSDENPLIFWEREAMSFDTDFQELSKLAKFIFSCKVQTASCERLFSAYGSIKTKKRNRLNDSLMSKMQLLKSFRKWKDSTNLPKPKPTHLLEEKDLNGQIAQSGLYTSMYDINVDVMSFQEVGSDSIAQYSAHTPLELIGRAYNVDTIIDRAGSTTEEFVSYYNHCKNDQADDFDEEILSENEARIIEDVRSEDGEIVVREEPLGKIWAKKTKILLEKEFTADEKYLEILKHLQQQEKHNFEIPAVYDFFGEAYRKLNPNIKGTISEEFWPSGIMAVKVSLYEIYFESLLTNPDLKMKRTRFSSDKMKTYDLEGKIYYDESLRKRRLQKTQMRNSRRTIVSNPDPEETNIYENEPQIEPDIIQVNELLPRVEVDLSQNAKTQEQVATTPQGLSFQLENPEDIAVKETGKETEEKRSKSKEKKKEKRIIYSTRSNSKFLRK